jgi:hypothetical protein
VTKLSKLPHLLLTALLACQLAVGAPVHAQPVTVGAHAAPVAEAPMAAHCAGHAMEQVHGDSTHHDSASNDKGCCGDSGCAPGACASHCAGAVASTSTLLAGMRLTPADPAAASLAAPRVSQRTFGVFRPPI